MSFFLINKYQNPNDNILFASKILLELLDEEKHIDELFNNFSIETNSELNINLERTLFLSITFLYSLNIVSLENNFIKRNEN